MNISKEQLKQLIQLSIESGIQVPARAIAQSSIFAANHEQPEPYLQLLDDGRGFGRFRPMNMSSAMPGSF